MRTEPVRWTEVKRQSLQEQLTGFWAEDVWTFTLSSQVKGKTQSGRRFIRFGILSPSLKTEIKYALRQHLDLLGKNPASVSYIRTRMNKIITWLNQAAPRGNSLLERRLEEWVLSLRSYLMNTGQFQTRRSSYLTAAQAVVGYSLDDNCIGLFRQLYKIIEDNYDDRPETEKDLWDLQKMGLRINPTESERFLNFTPVTQPWFRQLAKQFLTYRTSLRSAADCRAKLQAIRSFSAFLLGYRRMHQASQIDRKCIVDFIGYLQAHKTSEQRRRTLLIHLRVFFEVCAFQLEIKGITRERIILDDDLPKHKSPLPRAIPEGVLEQLRQHLLELPTTLLRMVVMLLECGMRISELCALPLDCLKVDDKHEWYLFLYQFKLNQELTIPLVKTEIVETIQAQQEEIKQRYGPTCQYLFPAQSSPERPYHQKTFRSKLNQWAAKAGIKDAVEKLYHFQAHQFRHTVGMQLINDDVPLDVIRRLFGHKSLTMTMVYARIKDEKLRAELQRVALKRQTVDYLGQAVRGDPEANAPEAQLMRKGIRGQTLPVGGCGRPVVRGVCAHENQCLTCVYWLTSTEDVPALKAFLERAVRLRQLAADKGNRAVITNQDRIIPLLQVRIASLEKASGADGSLFVAALLEQLKAALAEMEAGLEEAREAQLVIGIKHFEHRITELKAQIASLEGAL
jgi:integrase/recombinase XerD